MSEKDAIVTVPENRIITGSDLLNFNEHIDEKFDKSSLQRINLKLSKSNGFIINNLLTKEECDYYINESERKGYVTIEKEFPVHYRNNQRYLGKNDKFSEMLWERLEPLFVSDDLEGVRPYGFDQGGIWIPVGLDNCFTFGKYLPGSRFKPHYDAVFADSPNRRSIYTLQIYLNDQFEGGTTDFFQHADPLELDKHVLEDSVKPITGRAIIFNHDTLHCGQEVTKGEKYIVRVDMMFLRIDNDTDDLPEKQRKEMKIARELFFKADFAEKDKKDLESAISLYVKAQMLLVNYPSFDSAIKTLSKLSLEDLKQPAKKNKILTLDSIPEFQLFLILEKLQTRDACRLICTSKYFSRITAKDSLWKRYYIRDYSMEAFSFEQNTITSSKLTPIKQQMKKIFLMNNNKKDITKNWYLTYSNIYKFLHKSQIIIADVGSQYIKFGDTRSNLGSCIQRAGKRQEYAPHYVMSSFDRYYWVVGPNCGYNDNTTAVTDAEFKTDSLSLESLKEMILYVSSQTIKRKGLTTPLLLIVNPFVYSKPESIKKLAIVKKSLKFNELILFRNGGLLALQSHGLKSGIVLMVGNSTTTLTAFNNGHQVASIKLNINGLTLENALHDTNNNECKKSLFDVDAYTRSKLKNHWFLLLRVSGDYKKETQENYEKDHYKLLPEILFNPKLFYKTIQSNGIVNDTIEFINKMQSHQEFSNNKDALTILTITGGVSCIPNFIERFTSEMRIQNMDNVTIYASQDRFFDQIKGAKVDLALTETLHQEYHLQ